MESQPGHGTTFHVYFPKIDTDDIAPETESTEKAPGGKERILCVDDEEQIANMMKQMLGRLGYDVTAQSSSVEAFEVFSKQPDGFDLVITDQTMPAMTGVELAQKLRNTRTDIPIIVCTGFSDVIIEEKVRALGISDYVKKPIIQSEIAEAIRRLLDRKGN